MSRDKRGNASPSTLPEASAEPPSEEGVCPEMPLSDGPKRMRIKTKETAVRGGHEEIWPVPQHQAEPSRIKIWTASDVVTDVSSAHTRITAPDSRAIPSKRLSVKTKDIYTWYRPAVGPEQPSQAMEQGRRKFQREQKEKAAAKRFGQRRTAPETTRLSSTGGDKSPTQCPSLWRQIAQGGDAPVSTKGRVDSPAVSSRKAAVKVPGADKKTVGRKAGQMVKTAEQGTKQTLRSVDGIKTAGQAAQAIPLARRRAVQALRAPKKPAAATVKGAAKAGTAALRATVKAAQTLAAALAAGGSVVVSVILVLCLVGVLVVSPFGIFFAGSDSSPDASAPSAAVAQINGELSDYLAALQAGGTYDRTEILGQPPAWADVFAVFAAKTAGAADGVDVVTLDAARVDLLRIVFWDMTKITTEVETVSHPASGSTPAWSETVLKITITPRTPDDMRVFYSFTDGQNQALDSLLANGGMLASLAGDLTISRQDAKALLAALPTDLDPERRAVVETACQLVGKVNYFWGGKSRVLGWDERWGQIKKVTASGSSTSGTYRPFGLDCSGFVDWVFYNVTGGSYIIGHGGGAHSQHGYCTAITWDQAIPGDLVFYPGDTHVGIVGGRDEHGNLLIIHCAYSANNVVITDKSGFTTIGRPQYYTG